MMLFIGLKGLFRRISKACLWLINLGQGYWVDMCPLFFVGRWVAGKWPRLRLLFEPLVFEVSPDIPAFLPLLVCIFRIP